jgi:hypothetical protein
MNEAMIAEILNGMVAFSNGNLHDIAHFVKVWGFARSIGILEKLSDEEQLILEIAAITHDIACPLCREKYGNTNGELQEKEGALLVLDFLQDSGLSPSQIERVSFLVGHHHTLNDINGRDYRILVEADYIVNAEEYGFSAENIRNACAAFFRTTAGTNLLKSIFRL